MSKSTSIDYLAPRKRYRLKPREFEVIKLHDFGRSAWVHWLDTDEGEIHFLPNALGWRELVEEIE